MGRNLKVGQRGSVEYHTKGLCLDTLILFILISRRIIFKFVPKRCENTISPLKIKTKFQIIIFSRKRNNTANLISFFPPLYHNARFKKLTKINGELMSGVRNPRCASSNHTTRVFFFFNIINKYYKGHNDGNVIRVIWQTKRTQFDKFWIQWIRWLVTKSYH